MENIEEENIIKRKIPNTKFWVKGIQKSKGIWDVYMIEPEVNNEELIKEDITTETFNIFLNTTLKTIPEKNNKQKPIIFEKKNIENSPKNEDPLIVFLRIAFILLFIALPILWSAFHKNDSSSQEKTFYGYECQTSDCSGHKAGYEWAKDKNITEYENCGGKSESFIEGCKSYVSGEYNFGNNE